MADIRSKKYFLIIIPVLIVCGIFFSLYSGVALNPYGSQIKIMNKSMPSLKATDLYQWNNLISTDSFKKETPGRWYLINVWASWCDTCLNEAPFLMDLARQGVTIYGINDNDGAPAAKKWLSTYGNPYKEVLWDARSVVSIGMGVTSVPATFLIDPQGVIRCKVTGLLTIDIWKSTFVPLIEKNEVVKPEPPKKRIF